MTQTSHATREKPLTHFLDELRAVFGSRGGREAVRFEDRAVTYGELDQRARCWARLVAQVRVSNRATGWRSSTPEKLPFLVGPPGNALRGGGLAPVESSVHPRGAALLPRGQRRAASVVAGDEQYPVVDSLRSELPELRAVLADADSLGRSITTLLRAGDRPRRPVPDAVQLGHDRAAQGGRAHARQPRLQPARPARVLAIHARRRAGQRLAACFTSTVSRSRRI